MSEHAMKAALVSFPSRSVSSKAKVAPDARLHTALLIKPSLSMSRIMKASVYSHRSMLLSLPESRPADENEEAHTVPLNSASVIKLS